MIVTTTQTNSYQNLEFYRDLLSSANLPVNNIVCSAASFNHTRTLSNVFNSVIRIVPGDAASLGVYSGTEQYPGYMLFGNLRISYQVELFALGGYVKVAVSSGLNGNMVDFYLVNSAYAAAGDVNYLGELSSIGFSHLHVQNTGASAGNQFVFEFSFTGIIVRY